MNSATRIVIKLLALTTTITESRADRPPRGYLVSEAPLISYRTSAGTDSRRLIYVNNPESLLASEDYCDLADDMTTSGGASCAHSLHRLHQAIGNFRNWFEHTNRTQKTLKYAVRLYNPGPECATVRVRGWGVSTDSVQNGGQEFVAMFNRNGSTETTLCPGRTLNLLLADGEQAFPVGKFLAGVVDFDIKEQPLVVDNLAFYDTPAAATTALAYTQREVNGVREGLVYKGVSDFSEALAENINFTFDDTTPVGRLPVRYANLVLPSQHTPPTTEGQCSASNTPVCAGEWGHWGGEQLRDHWITHIAPVTPAENSKRMNGVVTDQISLYTTDYPNGCRPMAEDRAAKCFIMSPFFKWWYEHSNRWEYPNWGNWAVHYKLRGTMTNLGTRSRTIHLGLRADGNSPIAYLGRDRAWRHISLTKADSNDPNDYFAYSVFVVSPGESKSYWGEVVLSGPATGTLENFVRISD